MEILNNILQKIELLIEKHKPILSEDQKLRMYKIINPDIDDYIIHGVKISNIEKIAREIQEKVNPSYEIVLKVFKILTETNVEENKFVAFFLLNRYKNFFTTTLPELFRLEYFPYCHTWSTCDSCCIRVLGPFLAKKGNMALAQKTIDLWSRDNSLWIKRASLVLLLKVIMVHRDFNKDYVFQKVEKMIKHSNENYIAKGIGWLLKTCSKYQPEIITQYLIDNRKRLSRLILRYASEKLSKVQRELIMQK
ncbi:MAG: DNA alkylation repair protein [Candidatus Thorarchaeota archaeon]